MADEYSIRTGRRVERCHDTLRHPEETYLIGHVDRLAWDGERKPRARGQIRTSRILECKTAGAVQALREMKAQQKTLEADIEAIEAAIKKVLMDNATLLGPDGQPLATWKARTTKRLDQARLKEEHAELVAQYMTESTSRVFRLASKKALGEPV